MSGLHQNQSGTSRSPIRNCSIQLVTRVLRTGQHLVCSQTSGCRRAMVLAPSQCPKALAVNGLHLCYVASQLFYVWLLVILCACKLPGPFAALQSWFGD
eukprot:1056582-Amphidinium_carterae.1